MEAYQQFRRLYELARFDEALPYAKQRGRAVRGRRGARPRIADRLQQPRCDPVPARRLSGGRGQLPQVARTARKHPGHLVPATRGPARRARRGVRGAGPAPGRGGPFRPRARGEPPRRRPLQPAATAAHRAGRGQPLRDQRLRRRRARAHVRTQDRRAELRLRGYAHVAGAARARGFLRKPARVHRGPEHVPARARRRRSSRASTTPRRSGPWSASRALTGSSTRWTRTRSTASSRRATKSPAR